MNILYYFEQLNTPMYLWQNDNIVDELDHFGIKVEIFNPLHCGSRERANELVIQQAKKGKYDLFMTCHAEDLIYIDTLKEIKRIGIPTLLICFDNLLIPHEHKNVCRYFDLVWLTSAENQEMFQKWGANTIFLPYAANPFFYRLSKTDEIKRVCFIGTPYGSRANTINKLAENDVPVSLFGKKATEGAQEHKLTKGFVYTVKTDLSFPIGRKLLYAAAKQRLSRESVLNYSCASIEHEGFADSMAEVYSSYALSLATTTARNTGILKSPVPVVNLRSFEIPMSGGIQFCQYNSELSNYFEDGKEIIFYGSEDEMVDKAKFYLNDDNSEIRNMIRKKARDRAEAEHTWMCRFGKVFERLDINTSAGM